MYGASALSPERHCPCEQPSQERSEQVLTAERVAPACRDPLDAVPNARDATRHGGRRVGVLTKEDGALHDVLVVGARQDPARRVQGVDHVPVPLPSASTSGRM